MTLWQAVVWSVLAGFTAPSVFVPALVVGWLAPSARVAALGGAAIFAALFLYSQVLVGLPEGAQVIWWAAPLGLLPALAWASGSYHVFRRLRGLAGEDSTHPALRAVDALVGAIIGAIIGGAAALGLGSLYVEWAELSTLDGAAGHCAGRGLRGVTLGHWPSAGTPCVPKISVTPTWVVGRRHR